MHGTACKGQNNYQVMCSIFWGPMNVAIESLVVIYLKLAKLDQVNSRFSILWVVFNISTISNRGGCISSGNLSTRVKHKALLCSYYLRDTIIKALQQWEKLFISDVHILRIKAA